MLKVGCSLSLPKKTPVTSSLASGGYDQVLLQADMTQGAGLKLQPRRFQCLGAKLPIGSIVVPSCDFYTRFYMAIPKRNYYGA